MSGHNRSWGLDDNNRRGSAGDRWGSRRGGCQGHRAIASIDGDSVALGALAVLMTPVQVLSRDSGSTEEDCAKGSETLALHGV